MRRPRYRNQNEPQPRIRLAPSEIRVTNEEILGDLLYPAPAPVRAEPARRKARR